uniref:Cystinosin n=1 Tax=Romanomermis culicivorax TaxID=13658 RepID=A0A915L1M0_ROMCU
SPLNASVSVDFYCDSIKDIVLFKTQSVTIPQNDTLWHLVKFIVHDVQADFDIKANCTRNYTSECPFDFGDSYLTLSTVHSLPLTVLVHIFGWLYFVAWSFSFYPQIYLNSKRRSVIGLNFDFLTLNVTGFLFYALYNCALFWIPEVQKEFIHRYPAKIIPVLLNDVVFALHAFFACIVTILQCFAYERGTQRISFTALGLSGVFWGTAFITLVVKLSSNWLLWIDFFNVLSYIKLAITLIKYIPQALYNYKRKSTVGWSIGNILLDFTGGTTSLLQMVLIAYNNDTFEEFFANFTKFGLGFVSLLFDLLFMFQHYVLYRDDPGSLMAPINSDSQSSDYAGDNNDDSAANNCSASTAQLF